MPPPASSAEHNEHDAHDDDIRVCRDSHYEISGRGADEGHDAPPSSELCPGARADERIFLRWRHGRAVPLAPQIVYGQCTGERRE